MLFKVPADCNLLWGESLLNVYPVTSGSLERIDNISAICDFILKSKNFIRPDLFSLGFHFRKSRILSYFNKIDNTSKSITKGRGLVFHVCPSNVPLVYFYSAIYGYLAGNVNVVKISSRSIEDFKQTIDLIGSINQDLISDFYQSTCFITYDNGSNITSNISNNADMRVIWGGMIRSIRLRLFQVRYLLLI